MMAALPRDVIKFVIPKLDQENTMSQNSQEKLRFTGGSSGIGLLLPSDLSLKVPMSLSRVVVRLNLMRL